MAFDEGSINAVAIQRLNETLVIMDARWHEVMKEMREDAKRYQEKTDSKIDKMGEVLSKLVHIDTEMKASDKRTHHRIDEIEKRVEKVEINQHEEGCPVHREFIAKRNEQVTRFTEVAKNIDERLKTIETRGSKRWEAVVIKVLEYSAIFIIGAVAFKLGVKI